MLPYDYTKENYFQTGFVAEGLTTYYGDYMLARSGVRDFEEYTYDINLLLQRHFNNFGRYNYSLAESSWDLWLDGYVAGIPNRKVSIYAEGALVAFILDIELRRLSKNTKSLDDVLRILWNDFALKNKGYSLKDYQNIVAQVAGKPMTKYFEDCIFGRGKIETYLPKTLKYLGYKLQITPSKKLEEQLFGFKVAVKENRLFVVLIEPNSPADEVLTLQDELISIDNHNVEANLLPFIAGKTTIIVQILRDYKLKTVALTSTEKTYLNVYSIAKIKKENKETEENFNKWLGN
jgi:predicted metalloprotease with PDZ domain